MPRTIIILLLFLLALAPATAMAGGKAPVGKRVTRSYRAAGKATLVRVRVRKPHTAKSGKKGTKVRKAKQTRRGKVRRNANKRARVLRMSRTNTLVALGNALTGGAPKRMTKKRVIKKKAPVKKVRVTSYVRTRLALSGSLRDMAATLLPGSDLRKSDLALMRTAD